MPTYKLRCEKCNHEFETYCAVADRNSQPCQSCDSPNCKIVISIGQLCIDKTLGYYDPGLGEYVRDTGHRRALMKSKGLIGLTKNDRPITEQIKPKQKSDSQYRAVIKEGIAALAAQGIRP